MPTLEERFWSKVSRHPTGCWEWKASTKAARSAGKTFHYGQIRVGRREASAHRTCWELCFGPIPDGIFVCHACDNPKCVRPSHLFLGTPRDNIQDMIAKGRDAIKNGRDKTACINGHPFSNENTRLKRTKTGFVRICKECHRLEKRRYIAKHHDEIEQKRVMRYKPSSTRKRTSKYLAISG